jgi:hypothetical protein
LEIFFAQGPHCRVEVRQAFIFFASGFARSPAAEAQVDEFYPRQEAQQLLQGFHFRERAEVKTSVPQLPAGEEHAGEILARYLDIRIGLGVLPHLVEEGLQLVDELALGQQGFPLAEAT